MKRIGPTRATNVDDDENRSGRGAPSVAAMRPFKGTGCLLRGGPVPLAETALYVLAELGRAGVDTHVLDVQIIAPSADDVILSGWPPARPNQRGLGCRHRRARHYSASGSLARGAVLYDGDDVRNILKEEFGIDYEPYIYSTGLFDRAWPELRDAVERYWTPYVEEQQGYKEAAGALLRALTQE